MRFGCAVSVQDYQNIRGTGYDYAELPCRHVVTLSARDFSVLEKSAARGLPVVAMNLYCPPEIVIAGPSFDLNTARQYAETAAQRAVALGVKTIGIGSPLSRQLPEGFSRDEAMQQLITFLNETADVFGQRNIHVCLEALGHVYCNFINQLDEAVDVIRQVNHPYLHVVLDFYNMEYEKEADRPLDRVVSSIHHAHLSDDLNKDPKKRSYLLAEKEGIHRRRIRQLVADGYDDTLTLEIDVPLDASEADRSLQIMRAGYEDALSVNNG